MAISMLVDQVSKMAKKPLLQDSNLDLNVVVIEHVEVYISIFQLPSFYHAPWFNHSLYPLFGLEIFASASFMSNQNSN